MVKQTQSDASDASNSCDTQYRRRLASFVINLDGSDERMASVRRQMSAAKLDFTRISAFDGRKIPSESHPEYNKKRAEAYMGRPVLGGEIGCYKSHFRAVSAFLESDAKFGLILEDDMALQPQSLPLLYALIEWLETDGPKDWHLVNLAYSTTKFFSKLRAFSYGAHVHQIGRAHYFPMVATGLLWNRQGATSFLSEGAEIFAPVDNFFRYWLTRSSKGLAFDHPIILTTGHASDIDSKTPEGARKTSPRNWHYFFSKQARLNADKFRAWRHMARLRKALNPHEERQSPSK